MNMVQKLQRLSSPIPQSYREMMTEHGFHIADGAVMMFRDKCDLVSLDFKCRLQRRFDRRGSNGEIYPIAKERTVLQDKKTNHFSYHIAM